MFLGLKRSIGLALTVVSFAACNGTIGDANGNGNSQSDNNNTDNEDGDDYVPIVPFEAVDAHVYVSKVKNLLTGLPATDEEVASVVADPKALRPLVDAWFQSPESKKKFLDFYTNMFQQSNFIERDLSPLIGSRGLTGFTDGTKMVQNFKESFARTAAAIVENNESFQSTITTKTVYMTTAMLSFYLMNDTYLSKDKESSKISRNVPYNAKVGTKVDGTDQIFGGTDDGQLHIAFYYKQFTAPAGSDATAVAAAVEEQRALYEKNVATKTDANFMSFPMGSRYTCTIPEVLDTTTGLVTRNPDGTAKRIPYNIDTIVVNVDGYGGQPELKLFERLFNGSIGGIVGGLNKSATKPTKFPTVPVLPIPASEKTGPHAATVGGDYKIDCPFAWSDTRLSATNGDPLNVSKAYARDTDYTDWRAVTIVQDTNGDPTPFYDLKSLRGKTTVRLRTPKVGFFSTPAFQATYPSNDSNEARGLTNQALIVSIGKSINPVDKGAAVVLDFGNEDDSAHSSPDSPCYTCHRSLDPMRDVVLKNWTYGFSQQTEAETSTVLKALNPNFDFLGVNQPMKTLDDFANVLASHPLYAPSVTQFLCYYANSAPCSDRDEEFQRIAKAYTDSGYNFAQLVGEIFSSPIVTGATATRTWEDRGEVVSISRYNHICNSLTTRLGATANVCASNTLLATVIAADGFARGAESPTLSTDPTLFYRSAVEQLCMGQATKQVDATGGKYVSSNKDAALASFVEDIAGVSAADPAYPDVYSIISKHYDNALVDTKNTGNASQKATQALRSAFILACTAPTSMTIGL